LRLVEWSEGLTKQIPELNLSSRRLAQTCERVGRAIKLFEAHESPPMRETQSVNDELADVQEKLAQIRRRRQEVMRDVSKLTEELELFGLDK
jgi:chromosome segregation ATPase